MMVQHTSRRQVVNYKLISIKLCEYIKASIFNDEHCICVFQFLEQDLILLEILILQLVQNLMKQGVVDISEVINSHQSLVNKHFSGAKIIINMLLQGRDVLRVVACYFSEVLVTYSSKRVIVSGYDSGCSLALE